MVFKSCLRGGIWDSQIFHKIGDQCDWLFHHCKEFSSSTSCRFLSALSDCPPNLLLIVGWTGYLFIKAGGYGKAGDASAGFTRQVLPALSKMETGSRLFIIDMDTGQRFPPSVTIAYGFGSLMNLYYP